MQLLKYQLAYSGWLCWTQYKSTLLHPSNQLLESLSSSRSWYSISNSPFVWICSCRSKYDTISNGYKDKWFWNMQAQLVSTWKMCHSFTYNQGYGSLWLKAASRLLDFVIHVKSIWNPPIWCKHSYKHALNFIEVLRWYFLIQENLRGKNGF